jgi:hypothetical protein
MYQSSVVGMLMKRMDSAVSAASSTITSYRCSRRYWFTYIMALSSSMPGRMASSSASTPLIPVVRSTEDT